MKFPSLVLALVLAAGCGRDRPDLRPITLPDVSHVEATVQKQVRDKYAAVTTMVEGEASAEQLAAAFGEFGMLLHAAGFNAAAEPAYRNAETLTPADPRWPYYLGRLLADEGKPADAMVALRRSLQHKVEVPTLIRLGRLLLEQGQPEDAQATFEQARALDSSSVAALAGLGQAALARRDFARAAKLLEEALAINPRAASIHAPLAQAYRGLGDTPRAQTHLARWRNTEIPVPDPWDDQLRTTLQGGMAFESRGVAAFEAGRFAEAADLFRAGLAVTPNASPVGRSLRHKLGLALHLGGNEGAAVREFEEAVRLAPASGVDEQAAKAHYALGVIDAGHGRSAAALDHLFKAVAYDPSYVQARVVLGDALIQTGRLDEALVQHQEAVAVDPRSVPGRLGYARALIGLRRRAEAEAWLEESVRIQPSSSELRDALARVRSR